MNQDKVETQAGLQAIWTCVHNTEFTGTQKEYQKSKKDQDQFVTLSTAIQRPPWNIFWKYKDRNNWVFFL